MPELKIMGVLNLTPDSFYDGGKYNSEDAALARAETLLLEGADYLDLGGESSRPGSDGVSLEDELKQVIPVLKKLVQRFPKAIISVDTRKSQVAYQALSEGAKIINDISALRDDPLMEQTIRSFDPTVVLMHMLGTPKTMQAAPHYENVVEEVKSFLASRIQSLKDNGFSQEKIWIDPGIGFGKTVDDNLKLIAQLRSFSELESPVLLGVSRKTFIGKINAQNAQEILPPEQRLEGSLAAACWALLSGVSVLRVHDVAQTKKALQVFSAIKNFA